MTTLLITLFSVAATLLWLSTVGWLAVLGLITILRPRNADRSTAEDITVAVVIPTLNEKDMILPKLADMKRTDYPLGSLRVVVLDGGSTDGTVPLVQRYIEDEGTVELICLPQARGKAEQINHALAHVKEDIIVFTDADARLAPACIGQLVRALLQDRSAAIVGAVVHPDTTLGEELIYWSFVNSLWWLEGEAFGTAGISGVCYAVRRTDVLPLRQGSQGEDMHMALGAAARGLSVRLCRTAHASEVRVPQDASGFFRFRRRRGHAYLTELRSAAREAWTSRRRLVVCRVRLWHFLVTPRLALVAFVTGALVPWTPYRFWPLVATAAGVLSAAGLTIFADRLMPTRLPRHALAFRTCRLVLLAWLALLLQTRHRL